MKRVIEIFRTREELDKLVNLPKKNISRARNRSILAILCYAGLRVRELFNLKISGIKAAYKLKISLFMYLNDYIKYFKS